MAHRRDYRAESARRDELARERGFRNYWHQRTSPRYPGTGRELGRLPELVRYRRSDAMHVLDIAGREHLSIEEAARQAHVPFSQVEFFAGRGIKRRGAEHYSRSDDDMLRLRPMVIDGQVRFVEAHTRRSAVQAERIFDVQWRYAHGRATTEELAALPKTFHRQPVTRDPGTLVDVALAGIPQEIVDAYKETLGGQL
jgi:hypothetical protein